MELRNPILVTGTHRSGTTWVGKMLALSPQLGYIGEPFNPITRPGVCNAGFKEWFIHLHTGNAATYKPALDNTLNFRYDAIAELRAMGVNGRMPAEIKQVELNFIQEYGRFTNHHLKKSRPLMKDPIAFFSAEWLAREYGMQVLILVRHPAAFAASLKRLDWKFPFAHLAGQEALMEGMLSKYRDQIRNFAANPPDIIEQASLFWNCVYDVTGEYRRNHQEWLFLRHEDISQSPVSHFRFMFERFGLDWSAEIEKGIVESSRAENPGDWKDGDNPHVVRLNSIANARKWKKKLSADEIGRVRKATNEVSRRWYGEEDW